VDRLIPIIVGEHHRQYIISIHRQCAKWIHLARLDRHRLSVILH
jgi:hypothetical protein